MQIMKLGYGDLENYYLGVRKNLTVYQQLALFK